jgi:hypothetical protein
MDGRTEAGAGARGWGAALVRLSAGIVLAAVVAAMAVFLLVVVLGLAGAWSLRVAWARLTGRPVGAWHMGFDPAGRFRRAYGAAGRWQAGGRAGPAEAGPAAQPSARAFAGPLPLRSRQGVTDVEARPVEPGAPRD